MQGIEGLLCLEQIFAAIKIEASLAVGLLCLLAGLLAEGVQLIFCFQSITAHHRHDLERTHYAVGFHIGKGLKRMKSHC